MGELIPFPSETERKRRARERQARRLGNFVSNTPDQLTEKPERNEGFSMVLDVKSYRGKEIPEAIAKGELKLNGGDEE